MAESTERDIMQTKQVKFIFLLLLLPSFVFAFDRSAPRFLWPYLSIYEKSWNSGDVCRHAAAKSVKMAIDLGDKYKVPMFGTIDSMDGDTGSTPGHTLFILQYRDKYYPIDVRRNDETGRYISVYGCTPNYNPRDITWYSNFTYRDLSEFEGEASQELIDCWSEEDQCISELERKLSGLRDELDSYRSLLQKLESAYLPLFESLGIDYEQKRQRIKASLQGQSKAESTEDIKHQSQEIRRESGRVH